MCTIQYCALQYRVKAKTDSHDSLDARLFPFVVLAVALAVAMDKVSFLVATQHPTQTCPPFLGATGNALAVRVYARARALDAAAAGDAGGAAAHHYVVRVA